MAGFSGFITGILFTGAIQRQDPNILAMCLVGLVFTISFQVYRK